ncbi:MULTISPECIES: type II toxin-antitoxin system VapC family toxin [Okeania]|uniref:type II toxin-antitoxin system VapC family toxin n=1 Tax=Okeania TaxID=1458928 RepID=UPI001EFFDFA4|nr:MULTISPECIES: type II toxin-antitoxin system VapC family toxin [Okeania]
MLNTKPHLYYLGGRLVNPLPGGRYFISIITEIELLSYPSLTPVEEIQIRNFLAQITIVGIESQIKDLAIALRKSYRLKLPDAIVAATAQLLNAKLLTNDAKLINLLEIKTESVQIL